MATTVHLVGIAERAKGVLGVLAGVLKAGPEFVEDFQATLSAGDFLGFVHKVVLEHAAGLFAAGTDEEIEGIFTVLLSFLDEVPSSQEAGLVQVIKAMGAAIGAVSEGKQVALRLRLLAALYNTVSVKSAKLEAFKHVIAFAAESRQLEVLYPVFAGAASWTTSWGLTNAEVRPLFLQVSQALSKAGLADQAQAFLIRYLASFETEADEAVLAAPAVTEHAVAATLGYIKAPAVSQRSNLPSLKAVRALASNPAYAKLHDLLTIFGSKSLGDYLAFAAANKETLTQFGVDHESSVETMRLLTLCSTVTAAAASSGTPEPIPYATIAAALQCPASEVESWVVKALTHGLIDARMDQLAETVTVTRSLQRDFGGSEWMGLQGRLRTWRDNVSSLLSTVEGGAAAVRP